MTKSTQIAATAEGAGPTKAQIAEMRAGRLDDAHLAWFIAETECAKALRAWREGTGDDADLAFCSYVTALDREESAARQLGRLWEATEQCAPTLVQRMEETLH